MQRDFTFEFTGRLTADAQLFNRNDRQLIKFTVAVSFHYKLREPKDGQNYGTKTSFVNCTIWNPSEAQLKRLAKGALVSIDGFMTARAFQSEQQPEPVAVLDCDVSSYKVWSKGATVTG